MFWTPFSEWNHRYHRTNVPRSKNNQRILTIIFDNIKRTVGVPVVSFVNAGIEGPKDKGFPNSGDVHAEVELCFDMAGMALVVDLQSTSA